jgi:agmatinase
MGDVICPTLDEMLGSVRNAVGEILEAEKFPILLGGEHSLTPPAISKFKNVGVVILDAHLDFRDSYLDEKNSHACTTRRVADLVGVDNVISIGVRSFEKKEKEEADSQGLKYIDAKRLKEIGIKSALASIEWERIYLSLDMDFFDPSYAPGIGTPEFFGFSPWDAKECISTLAHKLVGFDVCETCPPFDNGNTSSLAARMVRDLIGTVWKKTVIKYEERYRDGSTNP